jgi:photosynthetic reaction center cytochrome c subunit
MKFESRRITVLGSLGTAVVCLLCAALAGGQAAPGGQKAPAEKPKAAPAGQKAPAPKPVMSEDFFKNVQVLKGIPVDEFMGTMGFFASALSLNCIDCHVQAALTDWSKFADDTPLKVTSRKMVLMVRNINQNNFGGAPEVTCYTCHRSSDSPKVIPSLTEQYEVVPDVDPNEVRSGGQGLVPNGPSADQILDKYLQALGGAQKLASLTSLAAKGTYSGFDTADYKIPVEVYAKAPAQRVTIAHIPVGGGGETKDFTTTYDGRNGWTDARNTLVPLITMTGGNLDGAKLDAELTFPGQIKQTLTKLRADFPETTIDDHAVRIVQGTAGKSTVKLYFDKQSGLLVRQLRYAATAVGLNPTEVDYSDYRDVPGLGIKLPYHWILSWTDGQSNFEMNAVQVNVPIDPAKFAKPTP